METELTPRIITAYEPNNIKLCSRASCVQVKQVYNARRLRRYLSSFHPLPMDLWMRRWNFFWGYLPLYLPSTKKNKIILNFFSSATNIYIENLYVCASNSTIAQISVWVNECYLVVSQTPFNASVSYLLISPPRLKRIITVSMQKIL
jgi:hypothetical protein